MALLLTFFIGFSHSATSQVNPNNTYVNGYYRTNGTYVSGYYRTTMNSTISDNYSTYPNINPYTGSIGTIRSYPTYSNYNSYYRSSTYSYLSTGYSYYSTPSSYSSYSNIYIYYR